MSQEMIGDTPSPGSSTCCTPQSPPPDPPGNASRRASGTFGFNASAHKSPPLGSSVIFGRRTGNPGREDLIVASRPLFAERLRDVDQVLWEHANHAGARA